MNEAASPEEVASHDEAVPQNRTASHYQTITFFLVNKGGSQDDTVSHVRDV